MISDKQIKDKVFSLINMIIRKDYSEFNEENEKDAFYYIISESVRATHFVLLVEDEFDIEFDDDDISISFFSSVDEIVKIVKNTLVKSK